MSDDKKSSRFLNECSIAVSTDDSLEISCSIMGCYHNDEVIIKKAETAEGKPHNTLILDLDIKSSDKKDQGTPQLFSYTENGSHVKDYENVTIRYKSDECNIKVK